LRVDALVRFDPVQGTPGHPVRWKPSRGGRTAVLRRIHRTGAHGDRDGHGPAEGP
jgi:hypothetical protein